MDETRQQGDGPTQETRNAIDALGPDVMRFATQLEARLKEDFQAAESRFEGDLDVKDYGELFNGPMWDNIDSLTWAAAEMDQLVERSKELRVKLVRLVKLNAREVEAAELRRENKSEPTTD